jgi:acyl carrier protein
MTDSLRFSTASLDEGGTSADRETLEHELAQLIVTELRLQGVRSEEIDREAPLFDEGLGLDSVDALQLAVLLQRRYGARISDDDQENRRIFSSLRSLASHVLAAGVAREAR